MGFGDKISRLILAYFGLFLFLSADHAAATDTAGAPAMDGQKELRCPSDTLGVSRVVQVDTQGGPRFGDQYPGTSPLAPGEVILTFDDGPFPKHTEAILTALAAQCTKATFFQVGSMAKNYPAIAQKVLQEGHTIGSHTWSHANLATRSSAAAKAQIERGITAVNSVLPGAVAPFFRFPYLSDTKPLLTYLQSRDIAVFSIDVDSIDYRAKSPDQVVRNVMNGLSKTGRGIILLHDIHAVTAQAVPSLLQSLKEHNYKVVHLVAKGTLEPVAMNETSTSGSPAPPPKRKLPGAQKRPDQSKFNLFDW